MHSVDQSSTTRIVNIHSCHSSSHPPGVSLHLLVGGGGSGDRSGAAGLDVLQVAGVAEEVSVQRVTAVTLLVVQLHLTVLAVVTFHMVVFVHRYNSNGFIRPL